MEIYKHSTFVLLIPTVILAILVYYLFAAIIRKKSEPKNTKLIGLLIGAIVFTTAINININSDEYKVLFAQVFNKHETAVGSVVIESEDITFYRDEEMHYVVFIVGDARIAPQSPFNKNEYDSILSAVNNNESFEIHYITNVEGGSYISDSGDPLWEYNCEILLIKTTTLV